MKDKPEVIKEDLEQEDYFNTEQIETYFEDYSSLIGAFIIKFNELEHEVNISIAKIMFDDDDSEGYRIVKFLNFFNKVEFFHEKYLERVIGMGGDNKEKDKETLKRIKKDLDEVRVFRNKLVHANWNTLTEDGFVRTKIESNKEEGNIQFVKVKMSQEIIKGFIERLDLTLEFFYGLDDFFV